MKTLSPQEKRKNLLINAARHNLLAFILLFFPDFVITHPHLEIISKMGDIADHDRGLDKLMINTSPQIGKSTLGYFFIAHYFGLHPTTSAMYASYSQGRSNDCCAKIHAIMTSSLYHQIFPKSFVHVDSSVSNFNVGDEGHLTAVGPGGKGTGVPAHLLIVDDLVKNLAEALSPATKKSLRQYIDGVLYTRLHPTSRILTIGTRWVDDDAYDYMLDDTWLHINIPALNKDGESNFLPYRTTKWWESRRKLLGNQLFTAMFQQKPIKKCDLGVIPTADIGYYNKLPPGDIVISIDSAAGDKEANDPSVITVALISKDSKAHIINVVRKRMLYPKLKKMVISIAEDYPTATILIENKSTGQSLIPDLESLPNKIISMEPRVNKILRLTSVLPQIENGDLLLPDNNPPWLQKLLDELAEFPNGTHDDQVDSIVYLLKFINTTTMVDVVIPNLGQASPW